MCIALAFELRHCAIWNLHFISIWMIREFMSRSFPFHKNGLQKILNINILKMRCKIVVFFSHFIWNEMKTLWWEKKKIRLIWIPFHKRLLGSLSMVHLCIARCIARCMKILWLWQRFCISSMDHKLYKLVRQIKLTKKHSRKINHFSTLHIATYHRVNVCYIFNGWIPERGLDNRT